MVFCVDGEFEYICKVMDFLKDYSCKEEYTRKVVDGKVVYSISNPGWSVERYGDILDELCDCLEDYCESNGLVDCMENVIILIE